MASTTAKMPRFAPRQIASVSTATAVKPGFFSNWRRAKRRSNMGKSGKFSVVSWQRRIQEECFTVSLTV